MPFRLLNKEMGKHCKLNGKIIYAKSLNINNCHGTSFKSEYLTWLPPTGISPFPPKGGHQSLSLLRSSKQFISLPEGSFSSYCLDEVSDILYGGPLG